MKARANINQAEDGRDISLVTANKVDHTNILVQIADIIVRNLLQFAQKLQYLIAYGSIVPFLPLSTRTDCPFESQYITLESRI